MHEVCSHEFFWPLKAADGHYYQVCRFCGLRSKYDWEAMQRVEGDRSVVASPSSSKPSLNLLPALEPAHRIFLHNLRDVLRPPAAGADALPSVPLWHEIFFNSDIPWQRFAESMVGHLVVLAVVLLASQVWNTQGQPRRRSAFENSHITYYKPTDSFPALRGNPGKVRPYKKSTGAAGRGSIHVAPEHAQEALKAPSIKLNAPASPNILASTAVAPVMPLGSVNRSMAQSQFGGAAGPGSIVAPPPEVKQSTGRWMGLPQGAGVGPAPQLGLVGSGRVMTVPAAAIIGPPPLVQASMRKLGELNIGSSAVVAPSPSLPMDEQRAPSGAARAAMGSAIGFAVAPTPSAIGSGTMASARMASLSGGGGPQIVPPSPSVQNLGNSGSGGGLTGSFSGVGLQVVPPSPSLQTLGNSAGGGPAGSFSGVGLQAVPPSPSIQASEGNGVSGSGRHASGLPGGAVQGVGPAPSVGGGGNSAREGRQVAMNVAPSLAPGASPIIDNARPKAEKIPDAGTEEMPLRVIGMAMALPTSSFFSNYEVYIAERRLRKDVTQLIKLVYVSLPYQRRLSEYGVDNSKIFKLLVSRDRSCDESLMQMTWPETDPHPDTQNAADNPALSSDDRKSMLPCYRTTADDYRKALSRH
jgi:hypothetical protein